MDGGESRFGLVGQLVSLDMAVRAALGSAALEVGMLLAQLGTSIVVPVCR